MVMTIVVNLSKKIPGLVDYSSVQASCSIEGELAAGHDPLLEAARLFGQAEAAVDRQLDIAANVGAGVPAKITAGNHPSGSSQPPRSTASPGSSPSPSGNGRRAPAPISPAQLRFLRQLCDRTPGAHDRILAEHHVASIEALSSRAASAVIDQLKAVSP